MIDNCDQKLFVLLVSGLLPRGQVYRLDVAHDDWCPKGPAAGGKGPCQCDPDLYVDGKKVEVPTS